MSDAHGVKQKNPPHQRILEMKEVHETKPDWVVKKVPELEFPKICLKEKPGRCLAVIREGDVAPFDGVVKTEELEDATVAKFEKLLELSLDAVEVQKAYENINVGHAQADRDADVDAEKEKTALWKQAAEDAKPSFFATPAFVVPVTAVITIGLCALAIKGAHELRE